MGLFHSVWRIIYLAVTFVPDNSRYFCHFCVVKATNWCKCTQSCSTNVIQLSGLLFLEKPDFLCQASVCVSVVLLSRFSIFRQFCTGAWSSSTLPFLRLSCTSEMTSRVNPLSDQMWQNNHLNVYRDSKTNAVTFLAQQKVQEVVRSSLITTWYSSFSLILDAFCATFKKTLKQDVFFKVLFLHQHIVFRNLLLPASTSMGWKYRHNL